MSFHLEDSVFERSEVSVVDGVAWPISQGSAEQIGAAYGASGEPTGLFARVWEEPCVDQNCQDNCAAGVGACYPARVRQPNVANIGAWRVERHLTSSHAVISPGPHPL